MLTKTTTERFGPGVRPPTDRRPTSSRPRATGGRPAADRPRPATDRRRLAIDRRRSATEYALLSAAFALSRSLAGWQSGFGAEAFGYADYFLLTFVLAFPAYLLLPWVRLRLRLLVATL